MTIVNVKCGWCNEFFKTDNSKGSYGYGFKRCPNCMSVVSSSKKQSTENIVGRKHIHVNLKDGDVV